MQREDRERIPYLQTGQLEKIIIRIVTAAPHSAVCSRERARVQLCRNHNANDDFPTSANIRIQTTNGLIQELRQVKGFSWLTKKLNIFATVCHAFQDDSFLNKNNHHTCSSKLDSPVSFYHNCRRQKCHPLHHIWVFV
jgi:hypothetical protein